MSRILGVLLNTAKDDKGLQIDVLNTAKNDKGLDNPNPNPNLESFVVFAMVWFQVLCRSLRCLVDQFEVFCCSFAVFSKSFVFLCGV